MHSHTLLWLTHICEDVSVRRQRFPQASFFLLRRERREGQRIRPVPLSRLVSNSSSPSRQACAGLWLGSPAARLGLWNNRRPPRRLGGVCEPRLRTGARLAEWCVLANTQLVCLPHANGPAFTTAHAIGSRRPDEHQAGLNKRPPPPLSRSSFSVSSPPLATILHFFCVSCTDACKFAFSTHPRRFFVQITDIFTCLLWAIGTCPRAEQLHSGIPCPNGSGTGKSQVSTSKWQIQQVSGLVLCWRVLRVKVDSAAHWNQKRKCKNRHFANRMQSQTWLKFCNRVQEKAQEHTGKLGACWQACGGASFAL